MKIPTFIAVMALLMPCVDHAMAQTPIHFPASAPNLLVEAKVSGNLESYDKGIRGGPDHLIYDLQRHRFVSRSRWHEYGVGFGRDLGVVSEDQPAFWMAEWSRQVEANLIVLSGVYPNQPQPETRWKIEIRSKGKWTTHARGRGGWYDSGRYVWGGPDTEPLTFDAIRVSVFSKDDKTQLKSIHFRGEEGVSWVVARLAPIEARIGAPRPPVRVGQPAEFVGEPLAGKIVSWRWDFGDGKAAEGRRVSHTFAETGDHEVKLTFSDGDYTEEVVANIVVAPPVAARIAPLTAPVIVGKPVELAGDASFGKVKTYVWDFGDGETAASSRARRTFAEAGIYMVKLTVSDGKFSDDCTAILRVHTPDTLNAPQVFLDTDQKNEQDDQHYFGYGLFSELDLLGVNSIHHGGGQEPINYKEILHVLDLARKSGLPEHRKPFIFHGANRRLDIPPSGRWDDTTPIITEASEAILAAARGASPSNPVWVVPVGPGTNVASAILLARSEGLPLKGRLRVMWLGGSDHSITGEFNGNNDPWSMYVVAQSGLETWIMPAPVGARVRIDKRTEADLYAAHPLGQYLRKITPARDKPLFDPSCLSAIISFRLGLGWVKEFDPVTVKGPERGYRWEKTQEPTNVRVIRQIDQNAMKRDIFNTMKGKPTRLIGVPPRR